VRSGRATASGCDRRAVDPAGGGGGNRRDRRSHTTPASSAHAGDAAAGRLRGGTVICRGKRRPLPAGSARALSAVPVDASASAFTVLLGAVRARWHLADILAVLHKPGLEHIRTERDSTGRRQRDPRTRQRMLARQWNKAVLVVQRTTDHVPAPVDDPTFPGRAAAVAERIAAVQARADAAPGRWHTRTGPSTRRVLDALCLLTATAVTATVEADTRRMARQRLDSLPGACFTRSKELSTYCSINAVTKRPAAAPPRLAGQAAPPTH